LRRGAIRKSGPSVGGTASGRMLNEFIQRHARDPQTDRGMGLRDEDPPAERPVGSVKSRTNQAELVGRRDAQHQEP
jgi:hypothetical protein